MRDHSAAQSSGSLLVRLARTDSTSSIFARRKILLVPVSLRTSALISSRLFIRPMIIFCVAGPDFFSAGCGSRLTVVANTVRLSYLDINFNLQVIFPTHSTIGQFFGMVVNVVMSDMLI